METSLLTTKLFVPAARPGLVPRPRLMDRLQAAFSSSLVLVSAPAGFGKTTLVSEWARQSREQMLTAWISLDEGDNDPVRFWDYVIAALRTLRPTAGETAFTLLHSPQPYPTEAVLTALINDLTAILDDFAVVLDDYHLIKAQPIHTGVAFLLDHLPTKMHLVIATRADPPLPLAHFRGRGTMLEIGADDLRFTLEEAAALLKEVHKVELAVEDVSALNARTEGWAVGLMMAALSIGKHKDIPGFIASFTGSQRHVMDYLIEEVLRQQPPEIQDFLLKTSVLQRLTSPLCDHLAGHEGSQEMLTKLEKANLFLIPLDESRQWSRYHHLFGELLRHHLEAKFGVEEVTALHRRASQWYEDNKFPDDAIHHALTARDWQKAMNLMYEVGEERIKSGEITTLLGWLEAVPEEVLRTNLRLYSQYTDILTTLGQLDAAETALSFLERSSQADTSLQGEVALFQTMIATRRGDVARIMEFAERALARLPPDNLAMRARASFYLGSVQHDRGFLDEARRLWSDAYEMGRQAGDYWVAASGANYLAWLLQTQGKLRESLEMTKQTVELAGRSPPAARPHCQLAYLLYERNDLEGAAQAAQLAVELGELSGQVSIPINAYSCLAQSRLAQGKIAEAITAMEKLDQAARHPSIARNYQVYHAAYHIILAIRQDDLTAAIVWGNRLQEYVGALLFDIQHIWARLLIARGEKTEAADQLRGLHEKVAQSNAQGMVIAIRVYQALTATTPSEALTFLAEALTLGQPDGFIRTFVDEGRLLAPLLRKALSRGITPEYTGKLLSIIEAEERQRRVVSGGVTSSPPSSGPLSERELEILRLVAAGLSNGQIAERLVISPGTAKTHVHHIFEKLHAKDRLQAATRARELKLI